MHQPDDLWVVEAQRNPEAFAELVQRYQDWIYNLAYLMLGDREQALDAAQETFLHAYIALPRFKTGAPFAPWLHRIAVNLCINYIKQRSRMVPLREELLLPDSRPSPEEELERSETLKRVQRAILSLPAEYRAVVILRHSNELSYQEIAQTLGISIAAVKSRLHRARELLAGLLRFEET